MPHLGLFAIGVLSMLLLGALGRFVAKYFVSEEVAPFVGFAFAIGAAFAGGFRGVEASGNAQQAVLNIGMVMGLTVVWYLFFKRSKSHG